MPKTFVKQLIAGVLSISAAVSVMVVLPTPVHAATDEQVQSAVQDGVQYLADNQASSGQINGFGGETEWSTVAVEASGTKAADFAADNGSSLVDFLKTNPPAPSAPATDIERKVIAISAAGEDTSNFGGVDYNTLLENAHNNSQIGDTTLINDDTFGVIAIAATKDTGLTNTAQDGFNYMLAHQAADGGFSYTTATCAFCGSDSNDTSAALIAMYAAKKIGLTQSNPDANSNALSYLLSTQKNDGGFGYDVFSPSDGSSTAWGLMALNTIGNSVSAQAMLARNWLLLNQNVDGGFSFGAYGITTSDTYTTAHAITALLGSTWLLSPTPLSLQNQQPSNEKVSVQKRQPAITLASFATPGLSSSVAGKIASASNNAKSIINKVAPKTSSNTKKKTNYAIYAVILLGLVAAAWFVLESQKARRAAK